MNRKSALACAVLALTLALSAPPRNHAQEGAMAVKLDIFLKESGYKSAVKVKDAVWTLDFSGKQIPKFKVVVTAIDREKDGIITAIVNPVPKDELPRNRTALTAAVMKANADFDYVKVAFDKDGDIFVRADIPPGTDLSSFKTVVEQVAAASDEFYGRIRPLLR